MSAWKPGPGWPSQAQLQYLAALVTVAAALVVVARWYRNRRGGL